jgi:hypothetical protein
MTGPIEEPRTGGPADPGGSPDPRVAESAVEGEAADPGEIAARADLEPGRLPPPIEPDRPAVAWIPPDAPAPPTGTGGWVAPGSPPGTGGWAPPAPPAGTDGWVAPPAGTGGGRYRGCLIGCAIVAGILGVLAVLSIVALIFLGGQIQSIVLGRMQFGTAGTGCSVTATAESFAPSTSVHFVALLKRPVAAGETITLVETSPEGTTDREDHRVDGAASCLFGDLPAGAAGGHYTVEIRSGSELLANGGFDVRP